MLSRVVRVMERCFGIGFWKFTAHTKLPKQLKKCTGPLMKLFLIANCGLNFVTPLYNLPMTGCRQLFYLCETQSRGGKNNCLRSCWRYRGEVRDELPSAAKSVTSGLSSRQLTAGKPVKSHLEVNYNRLTV